MSNIIVMAFSPRNIVGCLLKKKGLQKGGGVTGTLGHPRTPLATPLKTIGGIQINKFQIPTLALYFVRSNYYMNFSKAMSDEGINL